MTGSMVSALGALPSAGRFGLPLFPKRLAQRAHAVGGGHHLSRRPRAIEGLGLVLRSGLIVEQNALTMIAGTRRKQDVSDPGLGKASNWIVGVEVILGP